MPSLFITGAAQGIGLACAERFLAAGWFVGAYDIDGTRCQRWAQAAGPERAIGGALDVTDPAQWEQALATFTAASGGRLNVLLNNAGILADGPFAEIPLARQHALIRVNVDGVINGLYLSRRYLQRGDRVINMGSASAIFGAPSLATYAASKFAVRGLTEGVRMEWHRDGIHVSDLMPIFVRTAMVEGMTQVSATERFGVHLTPERVAAVALAAATAKRPKAHYLVGWEVPWMRALARILPDALALPLARRLAGW